MFPVDFGCLCYLNVVFLLLITFLFWVFWCATSVVWLLLCVLHDGLLCVLIYWFMVYLVFNLGCWCWFLFCVVIYTDCSGVVVYTFVFFVVFALSLFADCYVCCCLWICCISVCCSWPCLLFVLFRCFCFAFVGLLAVVYGCLGELFVGLGF